MSSLWGSPFRCDLSPYAVVQEIELGVSRLKPFARQCHLLCLGARAFFQTLTWKTIWKKAPTTHMTSFAMPSFAMPSLPSPDAPFCKCDDPNCPAGPLMRKMNEMPTDGHNKISIRYQWCVLVQGTDQTFLDKIAKECSLHAVIYVRTQTTQSTRVRSV